MPEQFSDAFEKLKKAAASLPEVEVSTSYGTPALKLRKKLLARVKDHHTIALMCALEEKEMLMAAAPDIYFETDHYKGWPAVLVRIGIIGDAELAHRLATVWRRQATATLRKLYPGIGAQ